MLDAKIASALNKIIQNSQFKKKVSLEEQNPERGPVSMRKTDRLHDPRPLFELLVLIDTILDTLILFSYTLRDDNIQEFDTRWDEVLLSMSKIPPMKSWKVSVQTENTWVRATKNRN